MSPQQKRMRREWYDWKHWFFQIYLSICLTPSKIKIVPVRDDHGGDPYRGGYDMGFGGGGGPSYGPPQHWGHPDLHLMQPHHGIPIQAR